MKATLFRSDSVSAGFGGVEVIKEKPYVRTLERSVCRVDVFSMTSEKGTVGSKE